MAKTKSKKLLWIFVWGVGALILFIIIGKSMGWIGKKEATMVELATAKKAEIIEKVSASGKIQPEVEIKISPDVSGEIIELLVAEGDSVVKGQLLLRIRPDNYELSVEKAKAGLNTTRANLAQAKAKLAQAQAQFVRAKAEYERNKNMYDQKIISAADFEQINSNYLVAQQELESSKQNVAASEFNIQSANTGLSETITNLSRTSIYAPNNGIISKLSVEKGERVVGTAQMAGTEILRVANLRNMEVKVDVNENDIVKINLGDTAIIDVDAYTHTGKKFKGIITSIANTANVAATADAVTEFEVKVRILNESYDELIQKGSKLSPFRPGMTASVDIVTERKNNILTVPLAAVTTRNPNQATEDKNKKPQANNSLNEDKNKNAKKEEMQEVVFVYDSTTTTVRMQQVKVGISDADNIEVISGLKDKEKVVSGPFAIVSKQLKDGDIVTTVDKNKKNKDSSQK